MGRTCEAVRVVVRVDALEARHRGGVQGYRRSVPGATYRSDGVVTSVGFADLESAGWWVRVLRMKGLHPDDIEVVEGDQRDASDSASR